MPTYSEKLKDPRWQKKRLEIFERDEFKCKLCNDKDRTLHVHHLSYHGNPWDIDNSQLMTLCEQCHQFVEVLKINIKEIVLPILKASAGDYIYFLIVNQEKHLMFYYYDIKNRTYGCFLNLMQSAVEGLITFYNESIKNIHG